MCCGAPGVILVIARGAGAGNGRDPLGSRAQTKETSDRMRGGLNVNGAMSVKRTGRGAVRRLAGVSVALVLSVAGLASGAVGVAAAAGKPATRAVSAGRDHRALVGDPTALGGRVSAGWQGLPNRWRIVSKPINARGHDAPKLSSATRLDARLRAKVPGRYTLRLTAGSGSDMRSDTVVLSEIPATPMVPFE